MAREEKRLILTRVGEREISEDTIISFPKGLIGFEEHREFVLLPVGDESPFLLLQSLDDPRLGFLVADPYPFLEDYQVQLDAPERQVLKLERDGQSEEALERYRDILEKLPNHVWIINNIGNILKNMGLTNFP